MHELALCGSIARIVTRHAESRRVDVVRLQVGKLRQVVPETLTYCWSLVTESTPMAGSRLDIEYVPVRVRCRTCASETELDEELLFTCLACGGSALDVVTGEECSVASIDVAAPVAAS